MATLFAPTFVPGAFGDPFSLWWNSAAVHNDVNAANEAPGNINFNLWVQIAPIPDNIFRADTLSGIRYDRLPEWVGNDAQPSSSLAFAVPANGVGDILQPVMNGDFRNGVSRSPFNFGLPVSTVDGVDGIWLRISGLITIVQPGWRSDYGGSGADDGLGHQVNLPRGEIAPFSPSGLTVTVKYQGSTVWTLEVTGDVVVDIGIAGIQNGSDPSGSGLNPYSILTYIFQGHGFAALPGEKVQLLPAILPSLYTYPTEPYVARPTDPNSFVWPPINGVIPYTGLIPSVERTLINTAVSYTRPDDILEITASGTRQSWVIPTGLPYNSAGNVVVEPLFSLMYLTGF